MNREGSKRVKEEMGEGGGRQLPPRDVDFPKTETELKGFLGFSPVILKKNFLFPFLLS